MPGVATSDETTTPLWLSHHHDHQLERCVPVGRYHLCRRCSVLYSTALATLVVALYLGWSGSWTVAAMWLLPLPAAIEWLAEMAGRWRYSVPRQVATTIAAGLALGLAFAAHFRQPFDIDAAVPVLFWCGVCVVGGGWLGRSAPTVLDEQ